MRKMHLTTSAVSSIAFFNGLTPDRNYQTVVMKQFGIKNDYPDKWACGVSCRHQLGVRDSEIEENGIKGGIKVTCPKCIEIIKKYGEK